MLQWCKYNDLIRVLYFIFLFKNEFFSRIKTKIEMKISIPNRNRSFHVNKQHSRGFVLNASSWLSVFSSWKSAQLIAYVFSRYLPKCIKKTMSFPVVQKNQLHCKQGAVRAVRFNVDGNYCMTAGADKSVKLWNPYKQTLLQTYMGHGYEVLDVQSSADSSHIASAGMDKCVFYWDVSTTQIVRKYRGHASYINAVKFNEESTVILSASVDNTVCAWDCRSKSREPIQILRDAKDSVTSLSVSDHEILTASLDGCVRRYDLRMGQTHQDDLGSPLNCVTFTKDGQCMLASCLDSTLRLVDKDGGEVLSEYTGHKNESYRVDSCLNNTDSLVVSGSEDGCVYAWDLIEGTIKHTLKHKGHKVVHSIAFHASKPVMLTAAEANVYLWLDHDEKSDDDDEK